MVRLVFSNIWCLRRLETDVSKILLTNQEIELLNLLDDIGYTENICKVDLRYLQEELNCSRWIVCKIIRSLRKKQVFF